MQKKLTAYQKSELRRIRRHLARSAYSLEATLRNKWAYSALDYNMLVNRFRGEIKYYQNEIQSVKGGE